MLALHDEAQAFAKETESLRRRGGVAAGIDKIAFLTTFKAVVLDGIAVVFIVIALGADGRLLVPYGRMRLPARGARHRASNRPSTIEPLAQPPGSMSKTIPRTRTCSSRSG